MVYTFARINAVLKMKVRDYFVQGRRGWVRLHEKGGKEHEVPCQDRQVRFDDTEVRRSDDQCCPTRPSDPAAIIASVRQQHHSRFQTRQELTFKPIVV